MTRIFIVLAALLQLSSAAFADTTICNPGQTWCSTQSDTRQCNTICNPDHTWCDTQCN